ncbi:hypothetical protein PPERSA_09929 [Pseudocohnilembus persalinus]|uniref:DNA sliding clamp PCNA n=1 Tax=Pseudocohnilembus persalinus TaxID=266149 RepID=A0A0V0QJL7_PSEPJ|nr:hypothetical protein PPERSA_09929 [Pseudocohnilembus persalinus]|eukprot:KRX02312.1 hypothetical protein PPERSA_09929 [Pseudocohnilembus persalinus]
MFEAKYEKGTILKKIIDSIKDLVKNVNIDANTQGLSLQAMDSSHVALVSLNLDENGFDNFRCDKQLTLGLSIENLQKILKLASNDDSITLSAEEEDASSLKFIFESQKGEKVSEFNLNLMTIDTEQLAVPNTTYSSVVTLPSQEFSRICRDMANISETISIEATKESVKFSVRGEIGEGSMQIKNNEGEGAEKCILEVDEPVSLSFALRYLNYFNKAAILSNQVTLSMSPESPIVVEYKIQGSDKDLGSLKFYLAPKIDDEEEQ